MRPDVRQFIEEILAINPGMAGLGSASSAIIGATGTEGAAGEMLCTDALHFARELSQASSDHERLLRLAQALEGSLLTVKMVSGMSDEKLNRLISTLYTFVPEKEII